MSNKTTVTTMRAAHRAKRTEQERKRAQGFNSALDKLKEHMPILGHNKKLSKIDTLKLAINYINALQQMLESDQESTLQEHAHTLEEGLSNKAIMMLAKSLNLPVAVDTVEVDPQHTSSSSYPSTSSSTSPQYAQDKLVYMDNGVWRKSGFPVPQNLQASETVGKRKEAHSFSMTNLLRDEMMN